MLKSLRQLHWSIYALSLASGVIMAGFMMMLPILPRYSEKLGFNEFEIGLLVAAFFMGRVSFQFPLGLLSDRIGRKLVMSGSLLLFAAVTTAFTISTYVWLMVALRIGQGVASAGFVVGFQAYVNDLTPTRFRGLAHGINSSAINAGIIVGPVIGGTLSEAYNLQAPFWVGGGLGALCFLVSLTVPPLTRDEPIHGGAQVDPAPLLRLRELGARVLTLPAASLSLIHFLQMMSLAVLFTAAPILTAELLSWSSTDIALALAASGAAGIISSPFLGRLADREGSRVYVMAFGLAVMALEGVLIYLHPGTALTIAGFVIGGAGAPAYFNSFFSLVGDVTLLRERGAVAGFIGSTAEWGSVIGGSVAAPLLWRSFSVRAPLALYTVILLATVLITLMVRGLLMRRTLLVRELEA